MKLQNSGFLSLEQVQNQYLNQKPVSSSGKGTNQIPFQSYLEQAEGKRLFRDGNVKFSKHAANRLSTRNIELSDTQMQRLEEGTRRAGEKGIKDSLVLVDSLAFIVNVPSSTVVTAMDQSETKENIFTNIDGAVIV